MAAQSPTLLPMGVVMMTVLTEGSTPSAIATEPQLRAWISRARAPYTTTLDSVDEESRLEGFFGQSRDTYIIIDLRTMTIAGIVRADVNRALRDLQRLLAQ
jgi:hypothetical protein